MVELLLSTGAEVCGVDPVAEPQSVISGVVIKRASAEALPYADGAFDIVTSQAVLEHLQNPCAVFAEFKRVLKPGGRVVFLTANKYDYVSLIARAVPNSLHRRLVKATEGRNEHDTFDTFYTANSKRQIDRIAAVTGFEVGSLEYLNQFPYALMFSPILCRLGVIYDKLVHRIKCLNWLQGWLIGVLRLPEGEGSGG